MGRKVYFFDLLQSPEGDWADCDAGRSPARWLRPATRLVAIPRRGLG